MTGQINPRIISTSSFQTSNGIFLSICYSPSIVYMFGLYPTPLFEMSDHLCTGSAHKPKSWRLELKRKKKSSMVFRSKVFLLEKIRSLFWACLFTCFQHAFFLPTFFSQHTFWYSAEFDLTYHTWKGLFSLLGFIYNYIEWK